MTSLSLSFWFLNQTDFNSNQMNACYLKWKRWMITVCLNKRLCSHSFLGKEDSFTSFCPTVCRWTGQSLRVTKKPVSSPFVYGLLLISPNFFITWVTSKENIGRVCNVCKTLFTSWSIRIHWIKSEKSLFAAGGQEKRLWLKNEKRKSVKQMLRAIIDEWLLLFLPPKSNRA